MPTKPISSPTRGLARQIALLPVHAYRKLISPLLGPRCKYYPTCSTYALDAVREFGALRGSVLAVWRVLRCNPLSNGGFDYVHDQKLFKSHAHGDCDHSHAKAAR